MIEEINVNFIKEVDLRNDEIFVGIVVKDFEHVFHPVVEEVLEHSSNFMEIFRHYLIEVLKEHEGNFQEIFQKIFKVVIIILDLKVEEIVVDFFNYCINRDIVVDRDLFVSYVVKVLLIIRFINEVYYGKGIY